MSKADGMGKNLTGIGTNKSDAKEAIEFAERCPVSPGNEQAMAEVRREYIQQSGVIGTVPSPSGIKGLASMALDAFKGKKASVFVDLLGERLAFERTGARLYDAVIAKYDALGSFDGGPTREELVGIRNDEVRHFGLIHDAIEKLGGDPTVITPAADVTGIQASGLVQVVSNPATTLEQCLSALLTAELVDNDSWATLIELADALGHDDMAEAFSEAKRNEDHHLACMRQWLSAFVRAEAHVEMPSPMPPGATV